MGRKTIIKLLKSLGLAILIMLGAILILIAFVNYPLLLLLIPLGMLWYLAYNIVK